MPSFRIRPIALRAYHGRHRPSVPEECCNRLQQQRPCHPVDAAVLAPYCASERRVGMSADIANGTAGNLIETLGGMRADSVFQRRGRLEVASTFNLRWAGEGGTSAASARRASAMHLCTATMREGNPDVRTSGRPRANPVVRTPECPDPVPEGKKPAAQPEPIDKEFRTESQPLPKLLVRAHCSTCSPSRA